MIGVFVITKNEEKNIARCLESVKWADEIVVYDSGSDDETLNIAKQYTDKIFVDKNWQGFGKQKQKAQQKLSTQWVLSVDADEQLSPDLKRHIQNAVSQNPQNTVFKMQRQNYVFGKKIRHSWSKDWVMRLYKNSLTYNDSQVHEGLVVPKNFQIKALKGQLLHFTYDSVNQYLQKNHFYIQQWVADRVGKKKVGIFRAILSAKMSFLKMYVWRLGFLDGRVGFLLAILTAFVKFSRYSSLWLENQKIAKSSKN